MKRLGYERYVSQGGDWGAIISQVMAVQAPAGLLGIHTNMPGTTPPSVLRLIRNREPAPAEFSAAEKVAFAGLETFYRKGFGYAEMMNTRPQTLGYGLSDSPVALAAFLYEKIATWTHSGGDPERVLTRDEILDNITLYWLTNTGTSSSRSYWDAAQGEGGPFNAIEIAKVPVAVTVFPGEIYRAPRSWGEQSFKKLIYWNEVDKGGHFAAWEQPELFACRDPSGVQAAAPSALRRATRRFDALRDQPTAIADQGRAACLQLSGLRDAASSPVQQHVGAVGLLHGKPVAAAADDAIRPFRVNVRGRAARGSPPAYCGDAVARPGDGQRPVAGHTARETAGARPLLGD